MHFFPLYFKNVFSCQSQFRENLGTFAFWQPLSLWSRYFSAMLYASQQSTLHVLSTLRTTLSLRYERIRRTVRVRKEVSTECEFNCYFKKLFLTRHFYHYFLTILLIFHTPILHTFATFAFFFFFHTPHFPQTCWNLTKDIFWTSIFNFNHIATIMEACKGTRQS